MAKYVSTVPVECFSSFFWKVNSSKTIEIFSAIYIRFEYYSISLCDLWIIEEAHLN